MTTGTCRRSSVNDRFTGPQVFLVVLCRKMGNKVWELKMKVFALAIEAKLALRFAM